LNNFPQVDVVVLNYNGIRFLDDCFNSLRLTTYPNFKLFLLDNASTEQDVQYTRDNFPEVEIIQNPHNNGFCAAYNLAFNHCSGDYFICLNNDVKVKPDWISHLVEIAEKDSTIAALQPKIVSFFNEKEFEYAGSSGGMMDVYGFPFLRGRIFDTIENDNGQYNDVAEIFWTCGAAMFIRKSVLAKVGRFDETIVHHMDEIDLNWRMHMMGYSCKIVPQSVILHYGGATIQPESFKKMYWNHRNSIYIMLKNYGLLNAFLKTVVHLILDYVAAFHSLITAKPTRAKAIVSAHWWIMTHLTTIFNNRKSVQDVRTVNDKEVLKKFYPKSIVWQYFVCKRHAFQELPK
jgi:GT2 family glycosyltransferase